MCRCTTEEEMTADIHTENTVSEQAATDNVTTTTLVDSKPVYVAKTRKKLVARATPMVSVAIDSTSKPAVAPTVPPLKRQSDLDKQFLANSLKVHMCVYLCVRVCVHMYKFLNVCICVQHVYVCVCI